MYLSSFARLVTFAFVLMPIAAEEENSLLVLRKGVVVRFASEMEGKALLGEDDAFAKAMGELDRSVRMKSTKPVSKKEFLLFAQEQVLPWTEAQKSRWRTAISAVAPSLKSLALRMPPEVLVVQTTGLEEGGAAYTRGNAVVLPRSLAVEPKVATFIHELFHVLSRQNKELRDRAYAILGFSACPEVALPGGLEDRRITNPDAFSRAHHVAVTAEGEKVRGVPILFSEKKRYDPKSGDGLFDYVEFRLMIVDEKTGRWSARLDSKGNPILIQADAASGYLDRVGRNTGYIIHPEEVMADNFSFLVLDRKGLPSPEVVEGLRKVLSDFKVDQDEKSVPSPGVK